MVSTRCCTVRLGLLALLTAGAILWPLSGAAQAPQIDALEDPLPRWAAALDALGVPGAAVAIVRPEETLLLEGLGRRDADAGRPVTPETRFYIASMTKPFVALGVVLLEDRGLIDLNRPVKTYLPRLELADFTETITITVRDLLAHRRGLQDYAITFGEAFSGQMTEERYYRLLTRVEAVGELDYQNLHYTLLGRVIEAVSGSGWKEYLGSEVLRPAGLARTTTRAAALLEDPDAAVPYAAGADGLEPVRLKTDRTMHAAGGMISTAADLARWIRIHLSNGRLEGEQIFPAEVIREMQKPQIYEDDASPFPEHRRIGWGLGWDLREDRGARLVVHGGSYAGWAAHMSFMPEIETGVVVLANEQDAGRMLTYVIALDVYDRLRRLQPRDLLPDMVAMLADSRAAAAQTTAQPPSANAGPTLPLDRYAGTYENEDWGTLEVRVEAGELRARIGDLPLPLEWTGPDAFLADGDQEGRFEIDASGSVIAVFLAELAAEGNVRFAGSR